MLNYGQRSSPKEGLNAYQHYGLIKAAVGAQDARFSFPRKQGPGMRRPPLLGP
jgi:hypothetical protein